MEIKYRDIFINYSVEGRGNTLVLLHGFTESLEIWDEFSAEISLDFRVVCVDLPGHGKSGSFGDMHTMEFMADCVKAVLDKEGIMKAVKAHRFYSKPSIKKRAKSKAALKYKRTR